ncbi:DUF2147 domain-containing protein [Lysobacter niabensis]|uniref:DUF2147 domain-containing protein n=1 Tax=Agrilutibacter niabensis TaxID=380628 RepID=UPI00360F5414
MRQYMMFAALLLAPVVASAQDSPAGRWQTVDDDSGKPKSVVEIYRARDGNYAGKVVEIIDTTKGADPLCDKCRGSNRNKPVKGMVILWGLKPDGPGKWSGGSVLDPENGKTYKSKIELHEGGARLGMFGCIAFICRQQVWIRQ